MMILAFGMKVINASGNSNTTPVIDAIQPVITGRMNAALTQNFIAEEM